MRTSLVFGAVLAAGVMVSAVHAEVFSIPPADVTALEQALGESSTNGEADVIDLAPGSIYYLKRALGTRNERLVVNGNGATLDGRDLRLGGTDQFLVVDGDGSVTIRDLQLRNVHSASITRSPIVNRASLSFVRSTVSASGTGYCGSFGFPCFGTSLLANAATGALSLESVTLTDNRPRNSPVVANSGTVMVKFSTIASNRAVGLSSSGSARIVGSIIADNEDQDCEGSGFQSLGNNLSGDGSCPFNRASDLTGVDPELGAFGDHGGSVFTLALRPGSPAAGAVPASKCPTMDARGYLRPLGANGRCDVGAFELGARFSPIQAANTATWYDRRHDGHFFTLEVLGGDRNQVLVHWNTFDADGNPHWLQGVGSIQGNRADMTLYEYGGMRYPSLDASDRTFGPWGALTLSFGSCHRAVASYEPLDVDLAPGESRLFRLTSTAGLSCEGDAPAEAVGAGINIGHTAAWYSPQQDGHFFDVQVLGGDRNQVLVHWNGYDENGNSLWLQGVGEIDGKRAEMTLYEYGGMRYPDFDPADRTFGPWGTLSLRFPTCDGGVARLVPMDEDLPAVTSELSRLVYTAGVACEE